MQSSSHRREEIQKRLALLREQREREQRAFDQLAAQNETLSADEIAKLAEEVALKEAELTLDVVDEQNNVIKKFNIGESVKVCGDITLVQRSERGLLMFDSLKRIYLNEFGEILRVIRSLEGKPAVELRFADGAEKIFFIDCLDMHGVNLNDTTVNSHRNNTVNGSNVKPVYSRNNLRFSVAPLPNNVSSLTNDDCKPLALNTCKAKNALFDSNVKETLHPNALSNNDNFSIHSFSNQDNNLLEENCTGNHVEDNSNNVNDVITIPKISLKTIENTNNISNNKIINTSNSISKSESQTDQNNEIINNNVSNVIASNDCHQITIISNTMDGKSISNIAKDEQLVRQTNLPNSHSYMRYGLVREALSDNYTYLTNEELGKPFDSDCTDDVIAINAALDNVLATPRLDKWTDMSSTFVQTYLTQFKPNTQHTPRLYVTASKIPLTCDKDYVGKFTLTECTNTCKSENYKNNCKVNPEIEVNCYNNNINNNNTNNNNNNNFVTNIPRYGSHSSKLNPISTSSYHKYSKTQEQTKKQLSKEYLESTLTELSSTQIPVKVTINSETGTSAHLTCNERNNDLNNSEGLTSIIINTITNNTSDNVEHLESERTIEETTLNPNAEIVKHVNSNIQKQEEMQNSMTAQMLITSQTEESWRKLTELRSGINSDMKESKEEEQQASQRARLNDNNTLTEKLELSHQNCEQEREQQEEKKHNVEEETNVSVNKESRVDHSVAISATSQASATFAANKSKEPSTVNSKSRRKLQLFGNKPIAKPIYIKLYENGLYDEDDDNGRPYRTLTIRPTYKTLSALKNLFERELGWRDGRHVDILYDATGVEIIDIHQLRDGQSVVASAGDRFVIPYPNTSLHRDAMRLSQ